MNLFTYFDGDGDKLIGDTLQPTASSSAASLLLGPCFVGWLFGLFVAGILSCLFFSYLTGPLYVQDSASLRACIWLVWLTALASALDNAVEAYSYGVGQARNYMTLRTYNISDCLSVIPQGTCALIVQLYLARRSTSLIENKSRQVIIRVILYTLVFDSWTFSVIQVVLTFFQRSGETRIMNALTLNLATAIWLWSNAAADIGITTSIYLSLRSRLSRCPNHNHLTDIVLQKLMRLSIYSACVTSLVAVGGAISASLAISPLSPFLYLNLAFTSLLPGLYGIVFIVTLMIREQLRSKIEGGPSAHPEMMTSMCMHGGQGAWDLPHTFSCPPLSLNSTDSPQQRSLQMGRSSPRPESFATSPSPELPNFQSMCYNSSAVRPDAIVDEENSDPPRRFQRLGSLF